MDDKRVKLHRLKIERQLLINELKNEYNSERDILLYDVLVQEMLYTEHECGLESIFTGKAKKIRILDEEIYKLEGINPPYMWNAPIEHIDFLLKAGKIKTEEQKEKTALFSAYLERKREEAIQLEKYKDNHSFQSNEAFIGIKDISQRIKEGENFTTEFKSTLRWNIKAQRNDRAITHSCLKTITAFLNTKGGTLFIGIDDSGKGVGIEQDKYKNYDQFENALYNHIRDSIDQEAATMVHSKIYRYQDVAICVVQCKSSSRPIFLRFNKGEEEFFVRTGPSSTKLTPSQLSNYIQNNF